MKEQLTKEQALAYIAAFIDGEGWVIYTRKRGKIERRIGFTNTNKILFDFVVANMMAAGFTVGIRYRASKNPKHNARWDAWLTGGKASYELFSNTVPLQHPEKKQRLKNIIDEYLTVEQANRHRAVAWNSAVTKEKQRDICRKMLAARWKGHVRKYPEKTEEQKERRRFLDSKRKQK